MALLLPIRFESEPLLWTVQNVYTPNECAQIIEFIEKSSPALASENLIYRNQDRVMVDDFEKSADLFQRLRPYLPEFMGPCRLVGLNERLRFYRYNPGQSFLPHMDHWYRPAKNRVTLHTVLLYFNEGFLGGETRFMEQIEETITPKAGMAAIFQHKVRHEGCLVRHGTKYAMRTETIYEAPDNLELDPML